jgi:hypothetical protein
MHTACLLVLPGRFNPNLMNEMRFLGGVRLMTANTSFTAFPAPPDCIRRRYRWGICLVVDVSAVATLLLRSASYYQASRAFTGAADRSKMRSMAGCLPNTKRFRHGRPDRGRC